MSLQEKQLDPGKTRVRFQASGNVPKATGKCFFTLNKFKAAGKYLPIYRSECKDRVGGTIPWNLLAIDTQTLCDDDNQKEIMIQLF